MTTVLLGCLTVFGAGVVGIAVALLLQRAVPARVRYDFGMYGALTSTLVAAAFIMSAVTMALFVWLTLTQASRAVQQEADAVTDLYWYSNTIDGPEALRLRSDIRDYVTHVIRVEWPNMAETGLLDARSWQLAYQVRYDIDRIHPTGDGAANRYQAALQTVDALFAARRARATVAATRIPALMWVALVTTGLLIVLMPMLRGDPRTEVRVVLAFVGAATVAFVVFILHEVNVPFTASVKVTPAMLEGALRSFADIDALWGHRP